MGMVKEPLEVDFVVDPRPITKEEEKMISDYIRDDKERRKQSALKSGEESSSWPKSLVKSGERTSAG
jgi:hypothetical protein